MVFINALIVKCKEENDSTITICLLKFCYVSCSSTNKIVHISRNINCSKKLTIISLMLSLIIDKTQRVNSFLFTELSNNWVILSRYKQHNHFVLKPIYLLSIQHYSFSTYKLRILIWAYCANYGISHKYLNLFFCLIKYMTY